MIVYLPTRPGRRAQPGRGGAVCSVALPEHTGHVGDPATFLTSCRLFSCIAHPT